MSKFLRVFTLILTLVILFGSASRAEAVREPGEDVYGFIDTKCNTVIPCKFFGARDFSEGLAPVLVQNKSFWQTFYEWGFIDKSGQMVIKPQFRYVGAFSEGLAPVTSFEKSLIGYIDKKGNFVIPPTYWFAGPFHNGLAVVINPDEMNGSLIDKQGKVLLHQCLKVGSFNWVPSWKTPENLGSENDELHNFTVDFRDGPALTPQLEYVDEQGKVVIPGKWQMARTFSEGLAAVQTGVASRYRTYGFIDKKGVLVIAPKYSWLSSFSEGLAAAEVSPKPGADVTDTGVGYVDKAGKMVIPPKFSEQAGEFHEGMARVSFLDSYSWTRSGFIDRTGKIVIKPQFDSVKNFSENLAAVYIDRQFAFRKLPAGWGYIDKQGKFISERRFEEYAGNFVDGLAPVGIPNPDVKPKQKLDFDLVSPLGFLMLLGLIAGKSELFRRKCALPNSELGNKQWMVYVVVYASAIVPAALALIAAFIFLLLGCAMANGPVDPPKAFWGFVFVLPMFAAPVVTLLSVFLSWLVLRLFKANQPGQKTVAAYFTIMGFEYAYSIIAAVLLSWIPQ